MAGSRPAAWRLTALARGSLRIFRRGSPGPDLHLSAAAVQQASNFAWADTTAEPGWELRRTPPLPLEWPPVPGGAAAWFCYAERPATAETIEVAGPWARITVPDRAAAPIVEWLSDAVESLGSQGIQPAAGGIKRQVLLTELRAGDPDGVLARALNDWRARNVLIAAAPAVAPHLPPVG